MYKLDEYYIYSYIIENYKIMRNFLYYFVLFLLILFFCVYFYFLLVFWCKRFFNFILIVMFENLLGVFVVLYIKNLKRVKFINIDVIMWLNNIFFNFGLVVKKMGC